MNEVLWGGRIGGGLARLLAPIRHYSSLRRSYGVPWQVERIQMPHSHSTALVLRAFSSRNCLSPSHAPAPDT